MLSTYLVAKDVVIQLGYDYELRWQCNLTPEAATESDFLREYAWVTLCCGMKERVCQDEVPVRLSRFLRLAFSQHHRPAQRQVPTVGSGSLPTS